MSDKPAVGILMGSDSDWPTMEKCVELLRQFGIGAEVRIMSAHRTPDKVHEYAASAEERGLKVLICAAGLSAALAGVAAANTTLPVIGVPMDGGPLSGIDALLSTVQMPPGTPVACVAIGSAGARNAAILAARILALGDETLRAEVKNHRRKLAQEVDNKDRELRQRTGQC